MTRTYRSDRIGAAILALIFLCTGRAVAKQPIAYLHPTESAPYKFDNTVVRLRFDFPLGTVYGDEHALIRPKVRIQTIPFHEVQLRFERVVVNGRSAAYALDPAHDLINVRLPREIDAGTLLDVEFRYRTNPQRGIYFVRPDRAYPDIAPEIWSQGEPTDNRRWFPTWDEPNEKTPSELILTVPRGWTAVANGRLTAHTLTKTTDTWDWNAPEPKSTYLIAFAAGPLVRSHSALGKLDVDSYVQPQFANLADLCFGRTRDMIAFYQRIIGVPYPFPKYDQITAERFVFGGMENESATIETTLALHPKIEDTEQSCDSLVSHELAQHWFGDDATMSDWSNMWLNEGFATYFDELWTGERFGVSDFEYARYQAQQAYFDEAKRNAKPIVDYVYTDPLSLFGTSSHEHPAAVLHMLRTLVGDAKFFGALRNYLREYTYKNADTQQIFASLDKSLGTNLDWFEDEWFFRSSYPHYSVTDKYDSVKHTLTLDVKQRNPDGKPFIMPIEIAAYFGGQTAMIDPTITRNEQTAVIRGVSARPDMVLFDPNNNVLRELTFPKSTRELAYQLANARHVGDREWALSQLVADGKIVGASRDEAVTAIGLAASSDPAWGVRADAVNDAATLGAATAVQAALDDRDVRVRIAAANASPSLRVDSPGVVSKLERMSDDSNPDVAAAALAALGAMRPPGSFNRLVTALKTISFQQGVAIGALQGLAAYGGAKSFSLIAARTTYGTPEQERDAAVEAMAQCAVQMKDPDLALPTLAELALRDPLIDTRIAATKALGNLHSKAATLVLIRVESTDSQELVREIAGSAI